jgi:hypothetical protein
MLGLATGVGLFGLALTALPLRADVAFRWMVYGGPYPEDFGPEALEYVRFAHAVLGGVLAGWAVLLIAILAGPFTRRERWAWRAIAASLAVWFVADTAASLGSGFWQNAVLNTAILAGFLPPLAATRRSMGPDTDSP